jgi:HAE1 family hydrophobic/amphiphilic exporter-1
VAFYVFWISKLRLQDFSNEDRGIIFADVTHSRVHLENTENTVKELDSIIESMDIVEARMNIVGFSLLNNINGGSYSFSVIKLKDWRNVLRMVNL